MNTLRHEQWRAFEEVLRRLYVHCDSERFPARLLAAVGPLLSSDIACYTELVPQKQWVRNVADHPDSNLEALLPVLAEFQMQHPRILDFVQNGQQRALTTSDYLSRRDWHKLDLFQHFYGAMNLEDQLAIMMPAGPDVHLGLVFNRSTRSFTREERDLLDLLRPHVALAHANAQAVSRLREGGEAESLLSTSSAHGVVRLRANGAVWFATRRADELIERFWPGRPNSGWTLPEEVDAWVRQQIRIDHRGGAYATRRVVEIRRACGVLTARLLAEPGLDGWLLLLETPDRGRAFEFATAALPRRLQRVQERLLLGESEKQIADRLALSPHTVHEYIKHLYRHMQVSSRAELMAKFIRSTRTPPPA